MPPNSKEYDKKYYKKNRGEMIANAKPRARQ